MPPEQPDRPTDDSASDPLRHRQEIELMERRFRQRSEGDAADRRGTGAIDDRVQQEMQQFFSESAQRLEEVVPSLSDADHSGTVESTGEIRRKINAFFGDTSDSPVSLPVLEGPARSASIREGLDRAFEVPSDAKAGRRGASSADRSAARAASAGADLDELRRARSALPARPRAAESSPGSEAGATMDLKSALQRLRRHGVVRDEDDSPSVSAATAAVKRSVQEARETVRRGIQPDPKRDAPLRESDASDRADAFGGAPPRAAQRSAPQPEPSSEGFDAIFAEVEGLVRGTLQESVEETFESARQTEEEMRSAADDLTRARSAFAAVNGLARPEEDEEEFEEDEPAAQPYDWGVQAAEKPPGAWLLEDGAEAAAREVSSRQRGGDHDVAASPERVRPLPPVPAPIPQPTSERPISDRAPDRAVRPSQRPTEPRPPAQSPPVQRPPAQSPPERRDASPASPPASGSSEGSSAAGMGARGLLARQLENESRRFQPCVDRLVERGVLDKAEVGDEDEDDDDELSVASFNDNRPRGDDVGMTPMRIVEEIRRLRRIQEALVRKGVLTEDEISSTTHGG